MTVGFVPYLMALAAMTFAALSALTLVNWINRFDPPNADAPPKAVEPPVAA